MLRDRSFTLVTGRIAAAVAFAAVVIVAQACSAQKSQIAEDTQAENLPEVGTLDDYLASGDADQYAYLAYGAYDAVMFDPFWFAPYWYPVPIYFLPGQHHHAPLAPRAVSGPLRGGGSRTVAGAAPTAPADISHTGGFGRGSGEGMLGFAGFGDGHMGGGGRR